MVRIVRITGAILLIIMIFLLTQIASTYYIDINKNVFSEPPAYQLRDYTVEEGGIIYQWRERHHYTKVDRLGTITLGNTTWLELAPSVILFLISLTVVGFLMMAPSRQFPLMYLSKSNLKRFWLNFSLLLALIAYMYSMNVFRLHGRIAFARSDILNLISVLTIFFLLVIAVSLANRTGVSLFSRPTLLLWLLIGTTIVGNGFLIDHFSTTSGVHEGPFLQSDSLGIAIFQEERHNWTLGYTVFRVTNVFLFLMGIAVASAVVSVQRKSKVRSA